MRRIISICKEVPLLPIAIIAAIPLALLGSWRPWEAAGVSLTFGPFNPGVGQWIVIALVVYTIVVTVIGMIDDLRHGHVGVDLLAVIAIASTVAVQEYWAAWAVVLMISSGEAIEEFAQSKAEGNLTALVDAAPRTAHVVTLPGVGARAAAAGADGTAGPPAGFEDEALRLEGRQDVRVDERSGVLGFTRSDDVADALAAIEGELLAKGWSGVRSGNEGSESFVKDDGRYRWMFVACVDAGGSTSVVVRYTTEEGA